MIRKIQCGFFTAMLLAAACSRPGLAADSPFRDAVAAWHFGDFQDSAGKMQPLQLGGENARVGVELEAAERDGSRLRGGDGKAAVFTGKGWLTLDADIPLTPEAMTWCVRVNPTKAGGLFTTGPFSLVLHECGLAIALIGIKDGAGAMCREVPLSPLRLNTWQDVVVRYQKPTLEFIVNGVVLNRITLAGEIQTVLRSPVLIGAWNMHTLAEPGLPKGAIAWLYERFLGGTIDHVAIWNRALSDAEIAAHSGVSKLSENAEQSDAQRCLSDYRDFHDASRAKNIAECERLGNSMRAFMARDKRRPIYHLTAPMDGLFDPAGAFFYDGHYNVFSYRNMISLLSCTPLAHYISDDLVHWRDQPIAIWADSPLDVQGIWLANLFIDDDKTPAMIYTALGEQGKIGVLARSRDNLISFTDKKAVMTDFVHHDGHTWKAGDTWFSITTRQYWGKRPDKGDGIHLLKSADLQHWTDCGEIWAIPKQLDPRDGHQRNGEAEFPYLLPFGDKHALIAGTRPVRYWIGRFDAEKPAFIPDEPQAKLLDFLNPFHCFNPSIVDRKGPDGSERRIILAMNAALSGNVEGIPWYGVHVLPRILTRTGNRLSQEPVPELQVLRGRHFQRAGIGLTADSKGLLPEISGDALEIIAEFKAGSAKRFGLKVRASSDGQKCTRIFFDTASGMFGAEGNLKKLAPYPELGQGPAYLEAGQVVRMHVFLDRALLEVFVNGQSLNGIFAGDTNDVEIDFFSEGGDAQVNALDVWEMNSTAHK